MTDQEVIERTVKIIRDLHDLKEDVLHSGDRQAEFDAGSLSAAEAILLSNIDDEDALVKAEIDRQCGKRLLRAIQKHGTT